jgi:hypothetical protein
MTVTHISTRHELRNGSTSLSAALGKTPRFSHHFTAAYQSDEAPTTPSYARFEQFNPDLALLQRTYVTPPPIADACLRLACGSLNSTNIHSRPEAPFVRRTHASMISIDFDTHFPAIR